jgi:hypothetical protein
LPRAVVRWPPLPPPPRSWGVATGPSLLGLLEPPNESEGPDLLGLLEPPNESEGPEAEQHGHSGLRAAQQRLP